MSKRQIVINNYIQLPLPQTIMEPPTPPTMYREEHRHYSQIIIIDAETDKPTVDFSSFNGDLLVRFNKVGPPLPTMQKTVYLYLEKLLYLPQDKTYTFILWFKGQLVTLTNCRYLHHEGVDAIFAYDEMVINDEQTN